MFSTEKRGFKAQVVKQFIGVMVVIIIGVAVRNYRMLKHTMFPVSTTSDSECDRLGRAYWNNSYHRFISEYFCRNSFTPSSYGIILNTKT